MLIDKRQSRQPSSAFKLRADIGFDSFILPGVGADLVTGAPVIMGSGESLLQNAYGQILTGTATNNTATAWTIPDASKMLSTTEATVLISGKNMTAGGGGYGSLGCGQDGTSASIGAYLPYHDGTVYWDFGGNVAGTTRLSVASLSFSDRDVFIFTSGPRGMEIWQNGKLAASNSATPTRTSTSNPFGVRGHYSSANNPFACLAFGYSRKQLPRSVCAELSRDLWGTAFVQRRRGIIAGIAAAARRRVVFWG